ncbi:MAG: tetratricopeptide repeat protein, partial [Candidatus Latescibacteria bacterium]|nr:tetratricopeptide repeat protein [Candidatus Latescibacterota bacterium]
QRWLEGAVERRPQDATLRVKLADAYGGSGHRDKARQQAQKALELNPDDQRAKILLERLR